MGYAQCGLGKTKWPLEECICSLKTQKWKIFSDGHLWGTHNSTPMKESLDDERIYYIRLCLSLYPSVFWSCFVGILNLFSSGLSVVSDSLWPHESQHARPPCPSPSPRVHSDSHPSSLWCHPAISSSVVPFSSCPQSLPASESFPMSQLFAWGVQSTGASALASFLPKISQGWSPLEWTGWISLQSKGPSLSMWKLRGSSGKEEQNGPQFSSILPQVGRKEAITTRTS